MSEDAPNIDDVSDATFETDVLDSPHPIVVGFGADWCGPCRAVEPSLEQLAETYAEYVDVARVDVDSNPQTPSNYGITSIPSFMLFVDGEVVDRVVGAVPEPELQTLFETALDHVEA
jgi:thioredoxin 1